MRVLGLVVARGGSKGLPGKNLRPLGGHPLVAWAVHAGRTTPAIDRVIISTDDAAIADVARHYSAEVPFMRPAELAADDSPVLEAILHALEQVEQPGEMFDAVCVLQPTAPFRDPAEIAEAIGELAADPSADSIVSLAQVEDEHPRRLRRIADGVVCQYLTSAGDQEGQQRQDHVDEPAYRRSGDFYIARRSTLLEKRSLYGDRVLPYVVPSWRAVNVDTARDLLLAEAMLADPAFRDQLTGGMPG